MSPLLTIQEVKDILKIKDSDTIISYITKGQLSAIKLTGEWRVSEDQLNDFLTSRTVSRTKRKALKFA